MSMVILGRYSPADKGTHDRYVQSMETYDDASDVEGSIVREKSRHRMQDAELTGMQDDIRPLDMEKAISDMKRDHILEDYQYFVGNQKHLA